MDCSCPIDKPRAVRALSTSASAKSLGKVSPAKAYCVREVSDRIGDPRSLVQKPGTNDFWKRQARLTRRGLTLLIQIVIKFTDFPNSIGQSGYVINDMIIWWN